MLRSADPWRSSNDPILERQESAGRKRCEYQLQGSFRLHQIQSHQWDKNCHPKIWGYGATPWIELLFVSDILTDFVMGLAVKHLVE